MSYTSTRDFKNKELGTLGEKIIANYFNRQGIIAILSENPFDMEKDLTIDGKNVEVKTLVPMIKDKAFMVRNSQIKKIKESHRTYFIAVPLSKLDNQYGGRVYELDPTRMKTTKSSIEHLSQDNICIPIHQSAMKHLFTITDEGTLKYMKNLSTSNF